MGSDAPSSFRRIEITAPRSLHLGLGDFPAPIAADEVEGRTIASVVSPGTELAWLFAPPDPSRLPDYPAYPGYAAVFEIARVGDDVTSLRPGDIVLGMGPHQGWSRHAAKDVAKLSAGQDPFTAGYARIMAVTMATLATTRARPPSRVGVSGLGVVGHLAAKIFAAAGYGVVAWDPSESRRAILASTGIDVRAEAPLDEDGIGLVLECAGHEAAVLDGCRAVAPRGEVAIVGVPWARRTDIDAHSMLRVIFERFVTLRSGWEWELPLYATSGGSPSTMSNLSAGLAWIADGRVQVADLARRIRPEDLSEVYERMLAGSWPTLTAIIDWS